MNKEPSIFLKHILESIILIEGYTKGITKEVISPNTIPRSNWFTQNQKAWGKGIVLGNLYTKAG